MADKNIDELLKQLLALQAQYIQAVAPHVHRAPLQAPPKRAPEAKAGAARILAVRRVT
jgi:hypothetical protein